MQFAEDLESLEFNDDHLSLEIHVNCLIMDEGKRGPRLCNQSI